MSFKEISLSSYRDVFSSGSLGYRLYQQELGGVSCVHHLCSLCGGGVSCFGLLLNIIVIFANCIFDFRSYMWCTAEPLWCAFRDVLNDGAAVFMLVGCSDISDFLNWILCHNVYWAKMPIKFCKWNWCVFFFRWRFPSTSDGIIVLYSSLKSQVAHCVDGTRCVMCWCVWRGVRACGPLPPRGASPPSRCPASNQRLNKACCGPSVGAAAALHTDAEILVLPPAADAACLFRSPFI